MKCNKIRGLPSYQCNKCNKNAMAPVERRESCKESTVLLASGESTPAFARRQSGPGTHTMDA